jgi:predicted nucleotide-binding protein
MSAAGAKEDYETLIRWADKYIRHPKSSTGTAVYRWRNKAILWLRQNLPKSGLADEIRLVPVPNPNAYSLSGNDIRNTQRALQLFLKARDLLPFLAVEKTAAIPRPDNASKVFVVHGHNDALKNAAARLVFKLGLEPVILHELPNRGRTLIEKFVDHSDVAFALILLTCDDRGGSASTPPEQYSYRARQNVIMELGYFLAQLGRHRVAAIFEDGVEIPSDYKGVVFIPYDAAGRWEFDAAKEMKAGGIRVDLNKL